MTPRSWALDHTVRRDDEIDVDVVPGGRDLAGNPDLKVVDRRDDDRRGIYQPGFCRHRELEIAEATAFAEPSSVLSHGDAPGDDEIDGLEVRYVDGDGRA